MEKSYFKTHGGIINIALLILNLICFICIIMGRIVSTTIVFLTATISGFCITGVFSLIHFFNLGGKLPLLWLYLEMIYAFLWAVYYMIMSPFILIIGGFPYIAAGIFAIMTILVYVAKGLHVNSIRREFASKPNELQT